jgi:hypothetical protein
MKLKPLFGDECNHCGLCCMRSQCPLSEMAFGLGAVPCPALRWDGADSVCGLLAGRPELNDAQREAGALMIGSGVGCDATYTLADRLVHDERWHTIWRRGQLREAALSPMGKEIVASMRRRRAG